MSFLVADVTEYLLGLTIDWLMGKKDKYVKTSMQSFYAYYQWPRKYFKLYVNNYVHLYDKIKKKTYTIWPNNSIYKNKFKDRVLI